MKRNLTFGKETKRFGIDFEIIQKILVWIFQIAIVCVVAFVLVWYFGQKVSCVGDSMRPVIHNADQILVNRIVYNASSPKRNDVIVFKPNGNENSHYYIKRIIGLPGETIEIKEGKIYINGKKISEKIETTELEDAGIASDPLKLGGNEYFVLGDNRKSSEDSRMADIGAVKKSEIYGKVWLVLSPGKNFGFIK